MLQDFIGSDLDISRNLFTPESLATRRPRPKELEVFALLSGLPFCVEFTDKLVEAQRQISAVLGECLHYWVAPENLGVEYCVFKWPTDAWKEEWLGVIHEVLASIPQPSFRFTIGGVQINPDGCVVAKGFDEDAVFSQIREQLKVEIPFLPAKQSGWAHVPLGRILEPLGVERFAKLAHLVSTMSNLPIATTKINSMKLIHETRWYMEEKTIHAEYPLASASGGSGS
ncbi:MAG: hypothetical protein FP815_00290 [Desulfobulbaceae bacterium]|nr:hypothetical protein [Desulfobulbaceae bacterium]